MTARSPWQRASIALPWQVAGALLLGVWWLSGLGLAPLFDVDEGAFAEASREMLVSGDWGHTTLQGADRFDKPILVYWLQAASMAVFGIDAWSVRLPSAVCGWLWCLVLAREAAVRGGEVASRMAALFTAGAIGPLLIGRAATADALLNLLMTCACLSMWHAMRDDSLPAARRAALWSALAVLTKGPVGVLVPLGTVLLWCLAMRRLRPIRRVLADPWTWLVFTAVSVPWYAYALARHGAAFVDGFFLHHNVERFGRALEGHHGSAWYTPLALLLLLLPWSVLALPMVRQLREDWRDPEVRYWLAWATFVVVLFALAATKLPHYALYAASPCVLLAVRWLPRVGVAWSSLVALPVAGTAVLAAASVQLAQRLAASIPGLPDRAAAVWEAMAPPLPLALLGAVCAAALFVGWPLHRSSASMARRVALLLVLNGGLWVWVVLPWWGRLLQGPVVELARVARTQPLQGLVQAGVHQPSLAFYAGRPAPRRLPLPGEGALVLCRDAARLVPQGDELARRDGWCLVRRR